MSIFKPVKFYKEDVLPTGNQLMPNALYFIRVGEEFDLYVTTNTTPVVAKRIVPGSTPVESGHIILWNGVEVTPRSKLNFRGFTLTDREELDEIEVEFNPEETLEGSPEDTDTLAILTQDVSDDDDDDDSSGEKGWLKITWANIKSTLKTYFDSIYPKPSGGGFIANVYFRADSSEVEGYKRISYLNELVPTELAITINNADGVTLARTYLYDDALETTILDAGVYIANYRVKVDTDNKETYLIFQAFVRHLNGEETVLFSSESPEISNIAYTTIRHESNQPNFTVLSTDRFGVRIYARTTRTTDVTINTIVGGEHASYFSTPIALRHSLTRGRDLADQHPAKAITVSDPVTPDFTPAVQGNNLQQVTNKVAGLQFTKIVEINLSENVTQIIETFDRNYNELIIYTELAFKDINNDPIASRANYTFNNVNDKIYSWGTNSDFAFFRTLNANTDKEVAIIHVKANVNNNFVGTTISAREAMSIYGVGFNSFSSIQISAIATFISNNSKLTIYGR